MVNASLVRDRNYPALSERSLKLINDLINLKEEIITVKIWHDNIVNGAARIMKSELYK